MALIDDIYAQLLIANPNLNSTDQQTIGANILTAMVNAQTQQNYYVIDDLVGASLNNLLQNIKSKGEQVIISDLTSAIPSVTGNSTYFSGLIITSTI